ncbi:phosphate ABC transporter permease subunit PstC [Actinotignum urinale]|uniref:Phosphate transport system permease protein n=1 Tax=Actinotignum urinale TaxID=190146 RepID=A0AAW9HNT2_9ACTO|nr:phosphate ABC transporter permease subunit PstC [Actinotignum urinale]MDY5129332.1 phosphate ABC transporter permease subunit PstC [Actinotignum urinale]MDY5151729.1 phosphate ABC transporter permease subunit PstC [Actinotignum urinale]MDY5154382.1 phosphate ABC transporter permease subunit PstC [Actinotignum urinale]WIK59720.1 phosphate ABC transporter permease subunit PstC [Actinotignum urinale]
MATESKASSLQTVTPASPGKRVRRRADKIFKWVSISAGGFIMVILGAVFLFLLLESYPAFVAQSQEIQGHVSFTKGMSFWQYAGVALFGTILSSLIALAIAVPFAVAIALFISHYASRKFASGLGYVIDLLAAIPSVVFGLWGIRTLEPIMRPIFEWVSSVLKKPLQWWVDYVPFMGEEHGLARFDWWPLKPSLVEFTPPARNILMGGFVLAIMILPIITSLCREVFLQTPPLLEEAALGLGATRWEMIKMTVLPIGRSGIVSSAMLGLGRALGETMALLMVLSPGLAINFNIFAPGQHSTIASQIALNFPEAHPGLQRQTLIGIGLMLFALTFLVNWAARRVLAKYAEFSGANA